ncbi:ABC transporter substrate-binding protein [Sediminicoccus sp. KRV36]|uniref:substrate-binding periplasmic protein n=1 Tax=Sediminicoccus sp. KRV36 TaxID=3133721 RepID=UPI00200C79BC|nr:ABC transporter substrate-binding protein [Sediminicoccus rosea]UPY38020.1 ABC transporter substrate-binding protein [Sediminicoccus rosea]
MALAIIAGFFPLCEAWSQAGIRPAPPTAPPAAAPIPPASPLPPRLDAIRARGELRVCIWPDYFAISFRNPRNSELEGLDIDLARALAARLSVRLAFVETNFASFMDRVEAGDCDIAMMGVGITPARAQRVAFSRPYLASPVYAVTTRNNPRIRNWADIDTPGTVVAVAAGTVMEPLMSRTLRRAELMVVAPPRSREAEIQAGRADVFMSDFPYTRRMVLMHDWAHVIEPPDRFGETLYAWALPMNDPAWLGEVNNFVGAMRADGTLGRAAARHGLTPILIR